MKANISGLIMKLTSQLKLFSNETIKIKLQNPLYPFKARNDLKNKTRLQPSSDDRDEKLGGILLAREGMNESVKALSVVSNGRFIWAVIRQWLVIVAAISIALYLGHWAIYLIMMLVIATRQHALGILMHDATHYRCLTNHIANDLFCDFFCALPNGILTSRYRYEHQMHHRFLNTDKDPYWLDFKADEMWSFPKKRKNTLLIFLGDLIGINGRKMLKVAHRWSPWTNHFSLKKVPPPLTKIERATVYFFIASLLSFIYLTNGWILFLILWVIPLSTFTVAMVRLRTIGEHLGLPNKHELDASRHTDGTLLERLSICPLNINYHIDHHLFPSVPYYNLPKLHQILLKNSHYVKNAHLNKTYLGFKNGLLGEILK